MRLVRLLFFSLLGALLLACGPLTPPSCQDGECRSGASPPDPALAECNGWVVRVWTTGRSYTPYQEYFVSRYTPDDLAPILQYHSLRDAVPRIEILNYHWSCDAPDQLPPDVPGACTYPLRR